MLTPENATADRRKGIYTAPNVEAEAIVFDYLMSSLSYSEATRALQKIGTLHGRGQVYPLIVSFFRRWVEADLILPGRLEANIKKRLDAARAQQAKTKKD